MAHPWEHATYRSLFQLLNDRLSVFLLADIPSCTAYAVYFDYKRRSDPDFRKALKRESRREARAAKEEAEAQGMQQKQAIENAVNKAREEGFPTDVEDKEAYFMNEVGHGEVLCQDGTFSVGVIKEALYAKTDFQVHRKSMQRSASTRLSKSIPIHETSYISTTRRSQSRSLMS